MSKPRHAGGRPRVPVDVHRAYNLLLEPGASYGDVARRMGVSRRTLCRAIDAHMARAKPVGGAL